MNDYYTYAYLRKDRTPYYIGKGRSGRVYDNSRRRYRCPSDRKRVLILKKGLTNEEAIKHEIYMIAIFGRKDLGTGILGNRTDGGEGTIGYVFTDEHKSNLRKAAKARKPRSKKTHKRIADALRGVPKSAEHVEKIAAKHRKPIALQNIDTREVCRFDSGKSAADALDLDPSQVAALRKGRIKTTKRWRLYQ